MSKYSSQLKDSVYEELKDERKQYVPGEVETAIMETLVPDRKMWPRRWNSAEFAPTYDMTDATELLSVVFPGEDWNLRSKAGGTIWECWVKDETYSVFCHTKERAIVLAIWNAHNFLEMENESKA